MKIEPHWKEKALQTAKLRRQFHAKFGSPNHWHDSKKGEYTDEYYGSLGHIVFKEHFRKQGLLNVCEFAPLYTNNLDDLPAWDALVSSSSVEIKTVPPDDKIKRTRMLVKVSEFKKLDFYVAIKFHDQETYSFCGMATGEEVASFPVRNFGFAPAYWCFLDKMPHPFEDLEQTIDSIAMIG